MDRMNDEMNVIEASGGDRAETKTESNNNFVSAVSDLKNSNDDVPAIRNQNEKRKKLFYQYLQQRDYQEALRSLLWEPYDCRNDSQSWYGENLEEIDPTIRIVSKEPQITFASLSESSLSSSSSCSSSLDEIHSGEWMMQRNTTSLLEDKLCNLSLEQGKDWKKGMRHPKATPKTMKNNTSYTDGNFKTEEESNLAGGRTKIKCTNGPSRNLLNLEVMVNDLNKLSGDGVSTGSDHGGALKTASERISARAIQYENSCCESEVCSCAREDNALSTVGKMLVTVEGTLEPRDSNEGTQLVSPDTSLDLNENPVRTTASNRVEPGTSGGNVSVVNCYRAVPVSVVSTVPTIKCLNTQESVSNLQIVQSCSSNEQKPKIQPPIQPKKSAVRSAVIPTTSSRTRSKPTRDGNRCPNGQNRHSTGTDQNFVSRSIPRAERERPKSANVVCSGEISCESSNPTSGLLETTAPTGSRDGSSVLPNHNRSISNPVLGNQTKPVPNKWGSQQQNVLLRLETRFGLNDSGPMERPQALLPPRNVANVESQSSSGHEPGVERSKVENGNVSKTIPRTFTSTEAQTDDVPLGIHPQSVINREQRRRERRERRHQRRLHQSVLNSGGSVWQSNVDVIHRDRRGLPDILNSHMPPPYSAVPVPAMSSIPPPSLHVPPQLPVPSGPQTVPHLIDSPPGQPLPHQNGVRFLFPFPGGRRSQGQMFAHEEETPKSCCGVVVTQTVSIRWFIVMISFVGICCVIVGTVLGAMKTSGREHLTVSLLMIGVGIVLVTVSVVAWRLTSQDAPSCRSMLGLGGADDSGNEPNQRFVPRMPPSYGRPHHPYAAMMYPEFQYRPPPPSYQASMQEYRLRLLLLERPNETAAGLQAATSPPPTYRSQAGSTLGLRAPAFCRSLPQSEYSHPPSYRSRTSSTRPTLDPTGEAIGSVNHSRNSSLLSHVSDQNGNVSQAVVNVISVVGNTVDLHRGDTDLQIDSIKLEVDEEVPIPPLRMLLSKGKKSPTTMTNANTLTNNLNTPSSEETKSDNLNLVTIVTVSDNNNAAPSRDHSVESDVLAHL